MARPLKPETYKIRIARKAAPCRLCDGEILRGELFRDGGPGRRVCSRCVPISPLQMTKKPERPEPARPVPARERLYEKPIYEKAAITPEGREMLWRNAIEKDLRTMENRIARLEQDRGLE